MLSCGEFIPATTSSRATLLAVIAACCWLTPQALAEDLRRATVWDLKLGQPISAQPSAEEFRSFACGSNGGPPLRPLKGWDGYKNCRPEATGLYEVYFEYDDEYEYIARAKDLDREVARWAGTTEKGFPIIVSALFADDGILKAVRIVTDSRPDHREDTNDADLKTRNQAYLLGGFIAARFGIDAARDCTKQPPAAGEGSVGDLFVKQSCLRVDRSAGRKIAMQVNYFRKPGQSGVNPQMPTQLTSGQFESSARVEIGTLE